jgi:hypothetical protein
VELECGAKATIVELGVMRIMKKLRTLVVDDNMAITNQVIGMCV